MISYLVKDKFFKTIYFFVFSFMVLPSTAFTEGKESIKAIYVPLADHYAGIVAYEKYRYHMENADYTIEQMKSWPLLRAYFLSGKADIAYILSPMAMDMFYEKPNFRWVSLLHRDGNALVINDFVNKFVKLPHERLKRKPDEKIANAFVSIKKELGQHIECAVPSLLSTHTVVLYKYLKDYGKSLNLGFGMDKDVIAIEVAPPKSASFIKKKNSRGIAASFEQSLPWSDIVETQGFGKVAWYSKDVMTWPNGHVECIVIATDECIKNKRDALKEVIYYIHKAGRDIEISRKKGRSVMKRITNMIRKYIPEHNEESIIQSLRSDLSVINYRHLNVDKGGLKQIMDYAVEGGILRFPIDIDSFADTRFSTKITDLKIYNVSPVNYKGISEKITRETKKRLETNVKLLSKLVEHPIIINAVKERNSKNVLLSEIKVVDRKWISGGMQEFVNNLLNNPVSTFLRDEFLLKDDLYTEVFLCDKRGAVVGESPKTSDYWQGDEDKFVKCYNRGDGNVFIGDLEFDDSTQSYTVQISVPVKDNGKTIGVLVAGIRNM